VRIIFSRKGFDSQYGGVASPILPDPARWGDYVLPHSVEVWSASKATVVPRQAAYRLAQ